MKNRPGTGDAESHLHGVAQRLPVLTSEHEEARINTRTRHEVAVLIPCYNEALTIGSVVAGFRAALPHARIYVFDNTSDDTARIAAEAGAIVRHETLQGKGHVVRRMFRDIEADLYVMVDGDGTYDPQAAIAMIELAVSGPCDMVNGVRVSEKGKLYTLDLFRQERPLLFFPPISFFLTVAAVAISIPLAITYFQTGLVPRFPTLFVTISMLLLACISFTSGLILDTITPKRR